VSDLAAAADDDQRAWLPPILDIAGQMAVEPLEPGRIEPDLLGTDLRGDC
jgi:hypothetical protein